MINTAITPYERALDTVRIYLRPAGLALPASLTPGEEEQLLDGIAAFGSAIQWARGDMAWFIYTKINGSYGSVDDKQKLWNDTLSALASRFGKDTHTIQNEISIAKAYPLADRIAGDTVTWSHHKLVVAWKPAMRTDLLLAAEENGWSVEQLHAHILQDIKRGASGALGARRESSSMTHAGMWYQQSSPSHATIETSQGSIEVRAVLRHNLPVLEAKSL